MVCRKPAGCHPYLQVLWPLPVTLTPRLHLHLPVQLVMQRVVVVVRCVEEVHTDDNMGAVGACVQCAEEGAGEDTYTAHFLRQLQEANDDVLVVAGEEDKGSRLPLESVGTVDVLVVDAGHTVAVDGAMMWPGCTVHSAIEREESAVD